MPHCEGTHRRTWLKQNTADNRIGGEPPPNSSLLTRKHVAWLHYPRALHFAVRTQLRAQYRPTVAPRLILTLPPHDVRCKERSFPRQNTLPGCQHRMPVISVWDRSATKFCAGSTQNGIKCIIYRNYMNHIIRYLIYNIKWFAILITLVNTWNVMEPKLSNLC
jgi:hypothetical protein